MNSQYIIVYNKVTVKNSDYQVHSYLLHRKSEIIVTAVPLNLKDKSKVWGDF